MHGVTCNLAIVYTGKVCYTQFYSHMLMFYLQMVGTDAYYIIE